MWLLSRRLIALAELIGLPRASMVLASHQNSLAGASLSHIRSWRQKAGIRDSICTIERIASSMWSLPIATLSFPLPKQQSQVNPQSYLYKPADITNHVLELDNIYSSGRPLTEGVDAVGTDQELRSLASLTPENWQKIYWTKLSIDALLQYWHPCLSVRTRLQLALKHDEGHQFAFNVIAFREACQELARRYVSMRPLLTAGLFRKQGV